MNTLHIKKNDLVVVLSGEEKGKSGNVLAVYPGKKRVLIEGINIVRKALSKSQDNPKRGIISNEHPIYACKVMLQETYEARRKKRTAPAVQEKV